MQNNTAERMKKTRIVKSFWDRYSKKYNRYDAEHIKKEDIPELNSRIDEINDILLQMSEYFDNKIIRIINEKDKSRLLVKLLKESHVNDLYEKDDELIKKDNIIEKLNIRIRDLEEELQNDRSE